MNIKKAFGSRQLCHKFANQHNVSVCAEKGSVRISIKSSFVSLMALSMEGQPIPLYTSAQLCVNHSSLILPSASSSLPLAIFISLDARSLSPSLSSFFPLLSLSFSLSVSQAAGNWMHKLLSPPPLTPTKSFPFSTLLSWDILFLHQICIPLIKLNYSWLPNIPCPDGCQHRNAWLWTCNDTAPTLKHELQPFPAPSTGRLPDTLGSWN